jgi:hypothetical protein
MSAKSGLLFCYFAVLGVWRFGGLNSARLKGLDWLVCLQWAKKPQVWPGGGGDWTFTAFGSEALHQRQFW